MIVSEAYLRIQIDLSDPDKRRIGAVILRIAETAGQEFFQGYETALIGEAVIEDGSSKVRARIRTSAIALVSFVGVYGTVRAGLDYMWHDGKKAARWMVEHMEPTLPEEPGVRRSRAPAAARLRKLFERIEAGEITAAEASEQAEGILREYLEQPDTIKMVVEQLSKEFNAISPSMPIRRERPSTVISIRKPTPIRAGKRLSVFRDPRTGDVRFVEE